MFQALSDPTRRRLLDRLARRAVQPESFFETGRPLPEAPWEMP